MLQADTDVYMQDPAWVEYRIKVLHFDTEAECFHVVNSKDELVNVEWATVEGATSCVELLEEGYLKE